MASGIFISYRRDESRHAAGRLADDLAQAFGPQRIFRDIEGIELGVDFAKALEKALASCAVMLVLIGPQWLDMPHAKRGGRRLDQEDDWIRQEIASALKRDVRVVPVLLEGATLPDAAELPADMRKLAGRQAMELSDARWRGDLQRLIDSLRKLPGFGDAPAPPEPWPVPPPAPQPASRKKWWWGLAAFIGVGTIIAAMEQPSSPAPFVPMQQQGLPSGYTMQGCACLGPNASSGAPEPRCASGQVRATMCSVGCQNGLPQVAYVCM
jgi:hypothetical protein